MRLAVVALVAVVAAGCGGSGSSAPKEDPSIAAVRVVHQITANRYAQAWGDLHSKDQDVAPLGEYVDCETRSPVIARPRGVKVTKVTERVVRHRRRDVRRDEGGRGAPDVRRRVQGDAHRAPRRRGRALEVDPAVVPLPRLQGEPLPGRPGLERAALDQLDTPMRESSSALRRARARGAAPPAGGTRRPRRRAGTAGCRRRRARGTSRRRARRASRERTRRR